MEGNNNPRRQTATSGGGNYFDRRRLLLMPKTFFDVLKKTLFTEAEMETLPQDVRQVAWHQDASYWPFTPARTVTAWLAIDDAD